MNSIVLSSVRSLILENYIFIIIMILIMMGCKIYIKEYDLGKFKKELGLSLIFIMILCEFCSDFNIFISSIYNLQITKILYKQLFNKIFKILSLNTYTNLSILIHNIRDVINNFFIYIPFAIISIYLSISISNLSQLMIFFTFIVTLIIFGLYILQILMNRRGIFIDEFSSDILKLSYITKRYTNSLYDVFEKYFSVYFKNDLWNNSFMLGVNVLILIIVFIHFFILYKYCNLNNYDDFVNIFKLMYAMFSIIQCIKSLVEAWINAEYNYRKILENCVNVYETQDVNINSIHLKIKEYYKESLMENSVIQDDVTGEFPLLKHIDISFSNKIIKVIVDDEEYEIVFNENLLCVLSGQSGCGKSTIIKILCGIIQSNFVNINDNIPINYISPFSMSKIAYLAQENLIMENLTILENFYLYGISEDLIKNIFKDLNIEYMIPYFNEKVKNIPMSGGQKRRLFISFILASQYHKILIMDEPFSSLDVQFQEFVNNIINKYEIVIVSEHIGKVIDVANFKISIKENTFQYEIRDLDGKWISLKCGEFKDCIVRKVNKIS